MSQFKTAAIFSDNMVLQREKSVCVFGTGEDGALVTVSADGKKAVGRVRDGRWQVQLPPHPAGTGYTLTASCGGEEITFANVAYGEVWLAGGQSNMELELQNCKEKDALTKDKNPGVRFYYTPKKNIRDKDFFECENNTCWAEFDSESAKCWSAVGYFFARELAEKLGVTVGVIGCNWGGTSASYWMSRESLEADRDTNEYLLDVEKQSAGKTEEEMEKEWLDYCAYSDEWNRKSVIFYSEHFDSTWEEVQEYCGKNLYPGPCNHYNPMSASALYHSMIKRVCPYTLRGFIYYQGESDDHRPKTYFKLFTKLIRLWREDWGDNELPFLFVQLPMHRYKADGDHKHWCLIREAQMKAYQTLRNTGIAVALDVGEFNEIHPKAKEPVGHRLALQALYGVYGFKNLEHTAFSPMYRECIVKGGELELHFKHCLGFKVQEDATAKENVGEDKSLGFEIAGADKEFKPADVKIKDCVITLSSSEVAEPLYARYCWTNYGNVNIFGINGLPLAPFRTCENDEK